MIQPVIVANRLPIRITGRSRVGAGQTSPGTGPALRPTRPHLPVTHLCYLPGFRKHLHLQPMFQGGEGPEKSYNQKSCLTSLSPEFPTMAFSLHPLPRTPGQVLLRQGAAQCPRGCSLDRVLPPMGLCTTHQCSHLGLSLTLSWCLPPQRFLPLGLVLQEPTEPSVSPVP